MTQEISFISVRSLQDWYDRGIYDAQRGKSPVFRKIGAKVWCRGEAPHDWTAEEENAFGASYLEGYDDAEVVR